MIPSLEETSKEAFNTILNRMKGMNQKKLNDEIKLATVARDEGKTVDVNGMQIDPTFYLTNLEAAERGSHPAFRWAQTDVAAFYGRPGNPSKRVLCRVYSFNEGLNL